MSTRIARWVPRPIRSRHVWVGVIGAALFAFCVAPVRAQRPAALDDAPEVAELERLSQGFSRIAENAKPSVVSIQAMTVSDEINKKLQQMFRDPDLQPVPISGAGSGVIFDADGFIVTNNHVVNDADAIQVTLFDRRQFRAELVGTDDMTDVAVLHIDADGLRPAVFGDSDRMKVGHLVLAIGSPFRFGHSVSHGIISAIGRNEVDVDIPYKNWLQTDAPINPGNSGGPLFNTRGEVVGLTVAIATESGGYQGVGFAIPSNTVRRIAEALKRGGRVVRGYLGVAIQPIDPAFASAYGLKEPGGVLISGVGKDTPAEQAGLKTEDIVLRIDDRPVRTREQLQELIAATPPGQNTRMTIWRDGRTESLTVRVGEQPDGFSPSGVLDDPLRFAPPDDAGAEADKAPVDERRGFSPPLAAEETDDTGSERYVFRSWGFTVSNITPTVREKLRVPDDLPGGVIVTRADPLGVAFQAGLRRGVVILRANDAPIRRVADLRRILTPEAVAKGVRLFLRQRQNHFFSVIKDQ